MMIRAAIATAVCLGVVYTQTGAAQAPQTPARGSGAGDSSRPYRSHVPRWPRRSAIVQQTYGCATGRSWGVIAATTPASSLPLG